MDDDDTSRSRYDEVDVASLSREVDVVDFDIDDMKSDAYSDLERLLLVDEYVLSIVVEDVMFVMFTEEL